jgi:hypothetical protein
VTGRRDLLLLTIGVTDDLVHGSRDGVPVLGRIFACWAPR